MSEEDKDSKTEKPTQKRLDDARKRGEVALSRELVHFLTLSAAAMMLLSLMPMLARDFIGEMANYFKRLNDIPADGSGMAEALRWTADKLARLILPAAMVILVSAVGANILQTGWIISSESLKPKLSKLSPLSGFKRIFGMRSFMEFAKTCLKLVGIASVTIMVVMPKTENVGQYANASILRLFQGLQDLAGRTFTAILSCLALLAIIDVVMQRLAHLKKLGMSRQDMKEEFRQSEGDPMIKARLRRLRMEKANQRMMAQVPKADVIITNPTHFAIALQYDPEDTNSHAPKLIAKGVDSLALRIREVAKENKIPIVENPPLARALYATVELDQEIPPEHYKAVAEVISYVFGLRQKVIQKAGQKKR